MPDRPIGRFVSLCMAGDARGARAMLERAPDLVIRTPKDVVHRAVWTKRTEAVKLVLKLGFDHNYQGDNAATHMSGVLAENQEILVLPKVHGGRACREID